MTTTITGNNGPEAATPANQPAAPAAEEFITKDEVARRLKKTTRTIENWQRRGILPFVKAGHSVLFKWSDVEAHLQGNFRVCRLRGARGGQSQIADGK